MPAAAQPLVPSNGWQANGWQAVRSLFDLTRERIHMGAMPIAAHPRGVCEAIAPSRRARLRPGRLSRCERRKADVSRTAGGGRVSQPPSLAHRPNSITMGVGLVYAGFRLKPGDEIVTTAQDHFVTHESLRLAAARAGATLRTVSLFARSMRPTPTASPRRCSAPSRPRRGSWRSPGCIRAPARRFPPQIAARDRVASGRTSCHCSHGPPTASSGVS